VAIAWDNLWKAWALLPNTGWPRIALVLWEFGLWGLVGLGALAGSWAGLAIGMAAAFWAHELLFRWWVNTVAGIPDADDGDVVGRDHRAILTLERWIGPVA